jgi:Leucine-rich repeat (LRR) protein
LKELTGLKQLQKLHLTATSAGATVEGLRVVASFENLRSLDLLNTKVTDAAIRELSACKKLQHLDIRNCPVSPSTIAELRKSLPDLRVER